MRSARSALPHPSLACALWLASRTRLARVAWLALACIMIGGVALHAAPAEPSIQLQVPETVDGILTEDVDGDGLRDVLVLGGRRVLVFPGRKEGLPEPAPRWTVTLPVDVSFVDALPKGEGAPALLVLGMEGARRLSLLDGKATPLARGAQARLAWRDWQQASFADLVRPDGSVLLPADNGWAWMRPDGREGRFEVPASEGVEPPGDFLQDDAIVTHALPEVHYGPGGAEGPSLWAVGGRSLVASVEGQPRRYDLSFLPSEGNRQLVELTGDAAPEVVHARGDNQERTFAFFGPPSDEKGSLRPALALLKLSGYCLDPDYTDLDGDGRLDFVVTTIPIDARNTARALGGNVTAHTRAFLNRGRAGGKLFPSSPDASMVSDVGVAIRFSAGGTIDIRRSFTILVTGDYDGDGRKDLAMRTGPETLTIHAGSASGVWEKEGRTVRIPAIGESPDVEGRTADLGADGRDEVLLLYRKPWEGRDRLWIVRP